MAQGWRPSRNDSKRLVDYFLGANSSLLMLAVSSLISGTKPKILMNSLLVTFFSVHCCYVAQLAELSILLDLRV